MPALSDEKIGVVIPAFNVVDHILDVIARIGPEVSTIVVVDDCCPHGSGKLVVNECRDPRVEVIFHEINLGVGGATLSGYRRLMDRGAAIIVKVDGDGQMAPELIPTLTAPIALGEADYAKGNRFFNPEDVESMPKSRLLANALLSFVTKAASGYWSIFDPANGYTAIHAAILPQLRMQHIARRYFFESDLLFRLGLLRCKVVDVPMPAIYGNEKSGVKLLRNAPEIIFGSLSNTVKRIGYNYFLRDFSVASLYLMLGIPLILFGVMFGIVAWIEALETSRPRTAGTVMLSVLPVLTGLQLILSFSSYDVSREPQNALYPRLKRLANHARPLRASTRTCDDCIAEASDAA